MQIKISCEDPTVSIPP